jgi:hypothetical protein
MARGRPLVVCSGYVTLFRFANAGCCRFTRRKDRDKLAMRQMGVPAARARSLYSVALDLGASARQID